MIGGLPITLMVDGVEREIRTDYRDILLIFEAFSEPNKEEFNEKHKLYFMLKALYKDYDSIIDTDEAIKQAVWFLNVGDTVTKPKQIDKPLYDWSKDEQIIFSGINKVAGKEIREVEYMHYWTFVGLFMEIGDGSFSYIVGLRNKISNHIKLTKDEEKYYKDNKEKIDLKRQYTSEELHDIEIINNALKWASAIVSVPLKRGETRWHLLVMTEV